MARKHSVHIPVLLVLGIALAVLLLVNSIANYVLVSQRVRVDRVRDRLSDAAVKLDQGLQKAGSHNSLDVLLDEARRDSASGIASVLVRNHDGAVIARAGIDHPAAFPLNYVKSQFRQHRPVFKVTDSSVGRMVIEAFPVRLPATIVPGLFQNISFRTAGPRQPVGVVEIGALFSTAHESFWPLKRSLLINCSAAVALLATITIIGLRFRSYVEGRHLERQLEIAGRVQADLLPAACPRVSAEFQVAAFCAPASEVGGDFYDAFATEDGGCAFVLGDVSGKGMPAALLMGVIHGAVRSCSWTESPAKHASATAAINRLLCEHSARERYSTMFWAWFDSESRTLHYINAGHCPPLLIRRNGEILRLGEGGPVLGLVPGVTYHPACIELRPGDTLIAYSDGIVEAANATDEFFGDGRLIDIVRRSRTGEVEDMRNRIVSAVQTFTSSAPADDDWTVLVSRYEPAAHSSSAVFDTSEFIQDPAEAMCCRA